MFNRMSQRMAVREADLCEEIGAMLCALPVDKVGMKSTDRYQLVYDWVHGALSKNNDLRRALSSRGTATFGHPIPTYFLLVLKPWQVALTCATVPCAWPCSTGPSVSQPGVMVSALIMGPADFRTCPTSTNVSCLGLPGLAAALASASFRVLCLLRARVPVCSSQYLRFSISLPPPQLSPVCFLAERLARGRANPTKPILPLVSKRRPADRRHCLFPSDEQL